MTRPEVPIDWNKVDELLIAGCLGNEIAAYFNLHQRTFYERVFKKYNMTFTAYMSEKKSKGDSLLRAHQFAKALGLTDIGDNTLLIWLGKNRLKQSDVDKKKMKADLKAKKELIEYEALLKSKSNEVASEDIKKSFKELIDQFTKNTVD